MKLKRFLSYEWDAIAGILAATAALILHLLHIVDEHIILPIVLALMALLFINFMRHTRNNEHTAGQVERTQKMVSRIKASLSAPDVVLVGPRQLRTANEQFARNMRGDAILFNVCLSMYRMQPLFDVLLRPAIENPQVTSIQFVLDESQQGLWQAEILPKITACDGHSKVQDPHWCALSKNISLYSCRYPTGRGDRGSAEFLGRTVHGAVHRAQRTTLYFSHTGAFRAAAASG